MKLSSNSKHSNRVKINKIITSLIYTQICDTLEKEDFINILPKTFYENKLRWCGVMIKNPMIQ